MKLFSAKIKAMCVEQGKTQTDMAKFIGVHQASLSKALRRGATEERIAVKIAQFLGVNVGEIAELNTGDNPDGMKSSRLVSAEKQIEDLRALLTKKEALIEQLQDQVRQQLDILSAITKRK